MSKPVGIITFHRAINYGAILQTYALHKTLDNLKVENQVIDYYCDFIEKFYIPKNHSAIKRKGQSKYKYLIKRILVSGTVNKKRKSFYKFGEKYLNLSKPYRTYEELKSANNDFSKFITGSDQVFSPTCAGFDGAYFLTFANHDKYSYAASFGGNQLPEDKKEEYGKRFSDFNRFSVREAYGLDILKEYGKDGVVSLDPTLLLDFEEWDKIAEPIKNDKYILIFNVNHPISDIDFAKKLGKEKGYKVLFISDSFLNKIDGVEKITAVSPGQFLSYIKNAEYVVTNSFHGTVFSIIFGKKFFVELNSSASGKTKRNHRAEGIMNILGISGREIINCKNDHIEDEIDYKAVKETIKKERVNSIRYLKEICDVK